MSHGLDFEARVREAERLVDRYIREKREAPARMALETLLDLYPNHPRRADLESWVALLGEEAAAERRAEERLAEGRRAAAQGDLETAERILETLEREAPAARFADELRDAIAEASRLESTSAAVGDLRAKVEALIETGRLAEAEREIERLSELGITKVAINAYRGRLAEARAAEERRHRREALERRYRELLAAGDWQGAREAALDLERAFPAEAPAAARLEEVGQAEQAARRRASVAQGAREVEGHLAAGRLEEAEMGLKILARMAPEEPRVAALERRLRRLKGA